MDTLTGDVYKCVSAAGGVYSWELFGSGGSGGSPDAVQFVPQTLTEEQKAQARENIGAATVDEVKDSLTKFAVSGDFVEFEPKEGSPLKVVSHYTQPSNSARTDLVHINSENLLDIMGYLGGPGTVIENGGLTATINADGTVTIIGTNTTSGWVNIINLYLSNRYTVMPPGTYTVPAGVMVGIANPGQGDEWSHTTIGNKSGTFTVDEWFYVNQYFIAYESGKTVDITIPLIMVRGSTLPTSDFLYSGQKYSVEIWEPDPGILDWSTGEYYDGEWNYKGTVSVPKITALPGKNYIWSIGGPVDVSGDSQFMGVANVDVADAFNAEIWGLPVLKLKGRTAAMTKDNAVSLEYAYGTLKGTCTCKWQGSSSISYAKKNYTIKFDDAFEAADGWGEQTKYCFKANYIDHSHARNIINAKLWGEIVKSRSPVPSVLSGLANYGAVDGFPVIITLNDEFHGLYTFNIPKDAWMFGMGSGTNEAILCADKWVDATGFKAEALADGSDFKLEYVTNDDDAGWVVTSLNRLINACVNSDGTDLDTTIVQYLDWQSAIDYYIFTVLVEGADMTCKNYLLSTFDGTKWYFSAYDMDSTHGLHWNGQSFLAANINPTFTSYAAEHRVMELIKTYKKDALKARYAQLRETVLSESNLATVLNNFTGKIPTPVYMQDVKKWSSIPNSSVNNASQIRDYYRMRVAYADKWIEEL
jgi:hypothetical protein